MSDNSVNQTVGALRFFFIKFLRRPWRVEGTPYPKKRFRLPVILSQHEVARLIESARTPFHRTILMTHCSLAYSALACFRIGISGSASFHRVRKSL